MIARQKNTIIFQQENSSDRYMYVPPSESVIGILGCLVGCTVGIGVDVVDVGIGLTGVEVGIISTTVGVGDPVYNKNHKMCCYSVYSTYAKYLQLCMCKSVRHLEECICREVIKHCTKLYLDLVGLDL